MVYGVEVSPIFKIFDLLYNEGGGDDPLKSFIVNATQHLTYTFLWFRGGALSKKNQPYRLFFA